MHHTLAAAAAAAAAVVVVVVIVVVVVVVVAAAAAAAAAASWRDHLRGRTTKCRLPTRAPRAVGRTISPARHDCVARGDPRSGV